MPTQSVGTSKLLRGNACARCPCCAPWTEWSHLGSGASTTVGYPEGSCQRGISEKVRVCQADRDPPFQPALPERADAAAQTEQCALDPRSGATRHTGTISGSGGAVGSGAPGAGPISGEEAYPVAGLPKPYGGLQAFTAAERDLFAGRER